MVTLQNQDKRIAFFKDGVEIYEIYKDQLADRDLDKKSSRWLIVLSEKSWCTRELFFEFVYIMEDELDGEDEKFDINVTFDNIECIRPEWFKK